VERDPAKLARLPEIDVDAIVDSRSSAWQEELIKAAGGQLDVCVDFVGTSATLDAGIAALGRAGTFVVVGVPPNMRSNISANPLHLISNEIVVTAVRYANRAEIAQSLELVRAGKVRTIVGASYPLEATEDALEAIRGNEVFGRVIIDCVREA
jgi:D-arabinose 1-dehydrogenase-like Zn-dependent alcohol dehydrogenase